MTIFLTIFGLLTFLRLRNFLTIKELHYNENE